MARGDHEIDSGWRNLAETALTVIKRFTETHDDPHRDVEGGWTGGAVVRLDAMVQPSVLPAVMIEYPVSMGVPAG